MTRDQENPQHFELNDVLGNYSLTLIDSLSTLAIIASSAPDKSSTGPKALRDFQDGVSSLVLHYGDGTAGPAGQGLRARGFDLDSKVQVFETVIRGVGGLLSAHLFASGELPINGYDPRRGKTALKNRKVKNKPTTVTTPSITWPNGFRYDGQLLRLALDLAQRLIPAFYTATGMPYPRVNLRHGIPFYRNSPFNKDSGSNGFDPDDTPEVTETCSAGAGSLVLEFTLLSRLTGDPRFEQLAKRAFWAVWDRRSAIGLIGAGVDAEDGQWIGPYAGIGAGSDSFFEYALKTYILLSGHQSPNLTTPFTTPPKSWLDPNTIHAPLSAEENSPEAFLEAWHEAHAAIKRHLYTGTHHPHYVNAHLITGSPQTYWIDSLGAYYPGLLTLAGEVEEAIETNLLYTALWTRYAALPERFSVRDGQVEGGLGWWPGRPEFIESNYHLYRATRDPWYLHVGEMVLKDIKRRCWTECGWSGLQDVATGEKSDRMESFFLGETAKYLYLLFDPDHPLNSLDAAYVFTTEGHPLIIPKETTPPASKKAAVTKDILAHPGRQGRDQCPAPPVTIPFTISATAARRDIFHASSLIGLHLIPNSRSLEAGMLKKGAYASELQTFPNHTYYPWTLPQTLMPVNGICDDLPARVTFSIEFPTNTPASTVDSSNFLTFGPQALARLNNGILVRSTSGLKLGMVYESPSPFWTIGGQLAESWRVLSVAHIPLGRDEQVLLPRGVVGDLNDPTFSRVRDPIMLDLVLQLEPQVQTNQTAFGDSEAQYSVPSNEGHQKTSDTALNSAASSLAVEYRGMLSSLIHQVTSALRDPATTLLPQPEVEPVYPFVTIPAITPTGRGASPIIDAAEAPDPNDGPIPDKLSWSRIFIAGDGCSGKLPDEATRKHQIIVMRRGGCSFSEKLANVPSYTPSPRGLKLVVIVSDPSDDDVHDQDQSAEFGGGDSGYGLIRPLLNKDQRTPSGLLRHHQVSMVMVGGGQATIDLFKRARSVGLRRRYHIESQGLVVGNIIVV